MLSATSLSFSYKKEPILVDVSFQLQAGELLHITGDNGSGKSTLLKLVAGLLNLHVGKISFQEPQPVIQYLNADYNGHYLSQSAFFNVQIWAKLLELEISHEEIDSLLERWGFVHAWIRRQMPVCKFSTGMRRKLALLKMFMHPGALLVLDEPANGIDQHGVKILEELLSKHLQGGGSGLITGFNLSSFEPLISRTLSLKKGKA